MRTTLMMMTALTVAVAVTSTVAQEPPRSLVAVWAHADDESPVGPLLARYARDGVKVHMIVATDGSQGAANTSVPRGPEIAKLRADEARCSAQALGVEPPILLGFPDSALGSFTADRELLFRLTQRLQEELQRLQPDALITWGPDGGFGHPDHRIISSVVTQLVRAEAPGVPQRLFYASIPSEGFRAMNPTRGVPPFMIPQSNLFTVRVPVVQADLDAARRSMACHKTQYSDDAVDRGFRGLAQGWHGEIALTPMTPQAATKDLFK